MEPVLAKQLRVVISQWSRLLKMDVNRVYYTVHAWAELSSCRNCKNWNFRVKTSFQQAGIYMENLRTSGRVLKERIFSHYCEQFKIDWTNQVNRDTARNGNGGNKLRQYRTLKTEYKTETYVTCLMPRAYRSALPKFLCGVAHIRIETGRN